MRSSLGTHRSQQTLPRRLPAGRVVPLLCLAEVLSMTGFATYPALMPTLPDTWGLSHWEAGLISGALYGGYMAAVPLLSSLTDRVDPRRIYVLATALSATGALAFAALAEGPVTAVALYTSSFGLGASLSLLLAGVTAQAWGWRWAFAVAALGPLAAALLVAGGLPPFAPAAAAERSTALLDFRPVFRRSAVLGYVLAYAGHCWELFGFRSWIVAFFAVNARFQPAGDPPPWSAPSLAAGINLLGPPASILGNEAASRLVAPVVFGTVLDAAGDRATVGGWGLAFASLGLGGALGGAALRRGHAQEAGA